MDPITLLMLAVLAVLIFFMFRNSRKRQRDAASLQEKMVVGAEVMTNSGVYGTLLSIDEEANQVLVETTPGTILRLHRQTVARVVEPETHDSDESEMSEIGDNPEFGERLDHDDNDGSSSSKSSND
ncbi:preprotein translocase subunit YajC [Homoserinimonas sp. OAct 916]|uniref:preprotein translocase subunit YajC n=1 Tax=Homoserinimonas sp. OAct 916 TaxID=2211450 RepID=UPI000DBE8DAE|nr:preprotein translocase subunit YajC [Homoserinimonas sp. OAct 916]